MKNETLRKTENYKYHDTGQKKKRDEPHVSQRVQLLNTDLSAEIVWILTSTLPVDQSCWVETAKTVLLIKHVTIFVSPRRCWRLVLHLCSSFPQPRWSVGTGTTAPSFPVTWTGWSANWRDWNHLQVLLTERHLTFALRMFVVIVTNVPVAKCLRDPGSPPLYPGGEPGGSEHHPERAHQIHHLSALQARAQPQGGKQKRPNDAACVLTRSDRP